MARTEGVDSTTIESSKDGTSYKPTTLVRRRNHSEALDMNLIALVKMIDDGQEEGFLGGPSDTSLLVFTMLIMWP